MLDLPIETWLDVISRLDVRSMATLRLPSRAFKRMVDLRFFENVGVEITKQDRLEDFINPSSLVTLAGRVKHFSINMHHPTQSQRTRSMLGFPWNKILKHSQRSRKALKERRKIYQTFFEGLESLTAICTAAEWYRDRQVPCYVGYDVDLEPHLTPFLHDCANLKSLSLVWCDGPLPRGILAVSHWPALQSLSISDTCVPYEVFVDFLVSHAQTLSVLSISNCGVTVRCNDVYRRLVLDGWKLLLDAIGSPPMSPREVYMKYCFRQPAIGLEETIEQSLGPYSGSLFETSHFPEAFRWIKAA